MADDRIAAALERIASALEAIAGRDVKPEKKTQRKPITAAQLRQVDAVVDRSLRRAGVTKR